MMQCPLCRSDAAESANYCAQCGAVLATDAPDPRDPHWADYVEYIFDRRVHRARMVRRTVLVALVLVAAVALVLALRLTRGSLWPARVASFSVQAPSGGTTDTTPPPAETTESETTPAAPPRIAESPPGAPPLGEPSVVAPEVTAPPPPRPTAPPAPSLAPAPSIALPTAPVPAGAGFEPRSPLSVLPSIVGRTDAVLVGNLVVDVHSEARSGSRERVVDYTVRLARRDGAPVTDAHVALRGETPDGATVEAPLDRKTVPGIYETSVIVPASGLHRLSLRITRPDSALELPVVPAPAS